MPPLNSEAAIVAACTLGSVRKAGTGFISVPMPSGNAIGLFAIAVSETMHKVLALESIVLRNPPTPTEA